MTLDFSHLVSWWLTFAVLGLAFTPITFKIFHNFWDGGFIFSKILGILFLSYVLLLLGSLRVLPFTQTAIFLIFTFLILANFVVFTKTKTLIRSLLKNSWEIILFEEFLFIIALVVWSYIRAYEPSIHGLEKYMDFGFVNSILRSEYFPPKDMWYTPLSINYYYFGHLVTAVLTKISGIPSSITYNLMLASLFAFTFTGIFSISINLLKAAEQKLGRVKMVIGGFLTAFLVTFAGNLHTLYAFFKPYNPEFPVPFWELAFSPGSFPNGYWYPNATRFIVNTIHEFPLYSYVVSDLHGHVLDIPVVLVTIALLFSIIQNAKSKMQSHNSKMKNLLEIGNWKLEIPLLSFLIAVMYMTNVWDTLIYFGLTFLVFFYLGWQSKNLLRYLSFVVLVFIGSIIFALPFSLHFKPFVFGIGVVCSPEFLTNIGKVGPFLFEADHCQRSPWWQLFILYGFFYFWAVLFLFKIFNFGHWKLFRNWRWSRITSEIGNVGRSEVFICILIILSTLLILAPEFIYIKDIYPTHYRANTMFKLVYQAFIMLALVSGYVITRILVGIKYKALSINQKILTACSILLATGLIFLVSIYPHFAINSYYGSLQTYKGFDGVAYLKDLYPTDYAAILWLRDNVRGQPVILEANGDSYTDYDRVSANTGLPTVIGWPVHEWLWRGSYDVAAPRIADVQQLYETTDLQIMQALIKKYDIELVFVGDLERQKYPSLNEKKFEELGKIIYESGQTRIYQLVN